MLILFPHLQTDSNYCIYNHSSLKFFSFLSSVLMQVGVFMRAFVCVHCFFFVKIVKFTINIYFSLNSMLANCAILCTILHFLVGGGASCISLVVCCGDPLVISLYFVNH